MEAHITKDQTEVGCYSDSSLSEDSYFSKEEAVVPLPRGTKAGSGRGAAPGIPPRRSERLRSQADEDAARTRRGVSRSPIRRGGATTTSDPPSPGPGDQPPRDGVGVAGVSASFEGARISGRGSGMGEGVRSLADVERELAEEKRRSRDLRERVMRLLERLEASRCDLGKCPSCGNGRASAAPASRTPVARRRTSVATPTETAAGFTEMFAAGFERLIGVVALLCDRMDAMEDGRVWPAAGAEPLSGDAPVSGGSRGGSGGALGGGSSPLSAGGQHDPAPAHSGASAGSGAAREPQSWARVVGRREKRTGGGPAVGPPTPAAPTSRQPKEGVAQRPPTKRAEPRLPRLPRGAAISIAAEEGREADFAGVVAEAIGAVSLEPLGITTLRPKRASSGALLVSIPGPDAQGKADALAAAVRAATAGKGVRVTRPQRWGEIRVRGLTELATPALVREALASVGECPIEDVRVGEFRRDNAGLFSAYARCPLGGVSRILKSDGIRIGLFRAGVELLQRRTLQCYRCLLFGHVRRACPAAVDRGTVCYRCGAEDHSAASCVAAVNCPVCSVNGLPAGHRMGGPACHKPTWSTVSARGGKDRSRGATRKGTDPTKRGPAMDPPIRDVAPAAPGVSAGPAMETRAAKGVRGAPVVAPGGSGAVAPAASQGKRRLSSEAEEGRASSDSPPRAPRKRSRATDGRRPVISESEPELDEEEKPVDEEMLEDIGDLAPSPGPPTGGSVAVAVTCMAPPSPVLADIGVMGGEEISAAASLMEDTGVAAVPSPAPPSDSPVVDGVQGDDPAVRSTGEEMKKEEGVQGDAPEEAMHADPAIPGPSVEDPFAPVIDLTSDNEGGETNLGEKISGIDPNGEIQDADLDPDGDPYVDDDRVFARAEYTSDSGQVWVMRGEMRGGEVGDHEFVDFIDHRWYELHEARPQKWSGRVEYAGTWTRCAVFRCPTPGGKSRSVDLASALEEHLRGTGVVVSEAGPVPPSMRSDLRPPHIKRRAEESGYWRKLRCQYAEFATHAKKKERSVLEDRRAAKRDTGVSFLKKGAKLFG